MKKNILYIMLFCLSFTTNAQTIGNKDNPYWTELITEQPEGYVVDENGDVEVSSAEGLAWLISVVNGLNGCQADDFEGRKVVMVNDIDLSEGEWVPIGDVYTDSTLVFKGLFYGNGHTIKNLFIHDKTFSKHYLGLFGYLSHAEVHDVFLDKGRVFSGSYCGGIAGWSDNGSLVDNCVVNLKAGADFYLGGIVGRNRNSTIRNCCYIFDNFGAWDLYSGGIAGRNEADGQDAVIENCYYNSTIEASLNTEYNGGIVGLNDVNGNGGVALVKNCYAELKGAYRIGGGIVGRNLGGEVSNCYYRDDYYGYDVPVIGSGEANYSDCSIFTYQDNIGTVLENPVSIGGNLTDRLVDALNLWRSIQNPTVSYNEWCEEEHLPFFCDQLNELKEEMVLINRTTLFPNPTNGIVCIEGTIASEVQVYNVLGQLVKTVQNKNEIDLSNLNDGVYTLQIKDENNVFINKKVLVGQQ